METADVLTEIIQELRQELKICKLALCEYNDKWRQVQETFTDARKDFDVRCMNCYLVVTDNQRLDYEKLQKELQRRGDEIIDLKAKVAAMADAEFGISGTLRERIEVLEKRLRPLEEKQIKEISQRIQYENAGRARR